MVALLLLVQGDNSMLATQRRVRVKKSGEESTKSKVCVYGNVLVLWAVVPGHLKGRQVLSACGDVIEGGGL